MILWQYSSLGLTGLIPNFVAMLDDLRKDGLMQEEMKPFKLMSEKSYILKVVVCTTTVVEGFFKAKKFVDAVRILKKMQSNGVIPNAFSYGVLIYGLCKGKTEEVGGRL
ncbi:pentatricopeptide repeat-containing At4g38150-like [Olea europaea subsp. europaea]|uniref:Pentatricopeptide repeat-containing At4g38150-like n=1 Tax=Olea europaea subsp. europaea TaxID=158383 RepID=A0A8S0UYJ6_OLEEU|nr:pentatricopeptide repeat-containing At4g38150-like [Olea europaea subsp. europaea]